MHKVRSAVHLAVATGLAAMVLTPGCGRAPEEVPPPSTAVEESAAEPLTSLELPQSNSAVGVTLASVPAGLVATFNENEGLEVADVRRPSLRYNFEADLPGSPSRGPSSVGAFETFVRKFNDGAPLDNGTLDTALGGATWASGRYYEEDQSFIDVRVFAPHPSGDGTLIVWTVSPEDVASVAERLSAIRGLLEFVS
jgi:hypothetical protein